MKILVVTQYFAPEPGATSNRLLSFVEAMVRRGHEVTVICEFPNHPSGILSRRDKWSLFRVERNGSYKVVRTFVIAFAKKNITKRMIFYSSFAISSAIAALFMRRFDLVFASSPPNLCAFTAMLVARLKGSKFVVDIRDLITDAASEMGTIRSRRLLSIGNTLDNWLYKNARVILTASKGFKSRIEQQGGLGKTRIIYNGSDDGMLTWNGDRERVRRSLGWHGKFVISYMGNIGLPQNLVEIMDEIEKMDSDRFLFVFVGDGPGKEDLKNTALRKNIANIRIMNQLPREQIIPMTHASDIMLIALRELEFFNSTIPSKFFDSMAAGKPVISNVSGELREFMEKYNTGLYFSYREENLFKDSIMRLFEGSGLRETMGRNGKKLVAEKFQRNILADEAVKHMESN